MLPTTVLSFAKTFLRPLSNSLVRRSNHLSSASPVAVALSEANDLVPRLLGGQDKLGDLFLCKIEILLKVRCLHQDHPGEVEEVVAVVQQVDTDCVRHFQLE